MKHPPPDNKDWTWVLERRCPDCELDAPGIDRQQIGAQIRANAAYWRRLLAMGDIVTQRPPAGPGGRVVWSAVEYGCHVRDVYVLYLERFTTMLKKDNPTFRPWDRRLAAIEGNYDQEEPDHVAYQLAVAAGKVADTLDRVSNDEWSRPGTKGDGNKFTVESLGRYLLHDATHHAWDAKIGLESL